MKFKEYLEKLNEFAKNNPQSLEMQVIYSKDDEGNAFNTVDFEPALGMLTSDSEFIPSETYREDPEGIEEDCGKFVENAICIN